MTTTLCLLACLGGIMTWVSLFPLRAYLDRNRILDVPNERSSHRHVTPRGGGLAIVGAVLTGWGLFGTFALAIPPTSLTSFALTSGLIALVSWVDDVRSVFAGVRFGVHGLAAALAILTFGFWDGVSVPGVGEIALGWFGLPITFFWIVGLTNAYNFMDGIDGIAGSQGIVAGIGWAILGWSSGVSAVMVLGVLLAASCSGFLLHNWSPARVFMGDVGSAFLGFAFALLPLIMKSVAHERIARCQALFLGILLVWPFVGDTAFTMARRLLLGRNIFTAHRTHLYQRLVATGLSHPFVTVLYAAFAAVGVALALGWSLGVPACDATVPIVLSIGLALWAGIVLRERLVDRADASARRKAA